MYILVTYHDREIRLRYINAYRVYRPYVYGSMYITKYSHLYAVHVRDLQFVIVTFR